MKKFVVLAMAMLFAVSAVSAQTPAEKQASADRIALLKEQAPKSCGVDKIDNAVSKCQSIASATVAISDLTSMTTGEVDAAKLADAAVQIKKVTAELTEVGKMMGEASGSLKELKNPMKLKPATKALGYAEGVLKAATAELPYQAELVAALAK